MPGQVHALWQVDGGSQIAAAAAPAAAAAAFADSQFQAEARQANQVVHRLRAAGADVVLALPEIVVCGDQSSDLTESDFLRLMDVREHAAALQAMAATSSYFKVAAKRYADYVPLHIDHYYLKAFARALEGTLLVRLGVFEQQAPAPHGDASSDTIAAAGAPAAAASSTEALRALLVEDAAVARRRQELTEKRARMEDALRILAGQH